MKGRERERDGEWGRQRETEIWDARNEYMMNIFSVLDRDIRVGFTETVRVEPRATKSEGVKNDLLVCLRTSTKAGLTREE